MKKLIEVLKCPEGMKYIIEILKGYVMGIANIIPGISGSTMAVSMGIYEIIIDAVNNVIKHPIKTLKSIWTYIVGIILGVVFGVFIISYSLEAYPLITSSLFIGLIIGVIPVIYKKIDKEKISIKYCLTFILTFSIIVFLPILLGLNSSSSSASILIYFIIGIISAGAMIIPGISGSMILLALGYYDNLTKLISETMKGCMNLDFSVLNENIFLLISFGVGIILGIIIIAKLIKYLFEKFNMLINVIILGLVVASPIVVLFEVDYTQVNIVKVIVAVITLGLGYYIANIFNKLGGKE